MSSNFGPNVHVLANGGTVITTSAHGFKFSDGTSCGPQDVQFVSQFTLKKSYKVSRQIKGMNLTCSKFVVSEEQYNLLQDIASKADIVLVSFQLLQALHDTFGANAAFGNVVCFNATPETSRSAPNDKIVDVNNWSVID